MVNSSKILPEKRDDDKKLADCGLQERRGRAIIEQLQGGLAPATQEV